MEYRNRRKEVEGKRKLRQIDIKNQAASTFNGNELRENSTKRQCMEGTNEWEICMAVAALLGPNELEGYEDCVF